MLVIDLQLELPTRGAAEVIAATRATGILPVAADTAAFTAQEREELCQAFVEGMHASAERVAAHEREEFGRRGWAFRWFQSWQPAGKVQELQAKAMDAALEVTERYYPAILSRSLDHPEDMGILQSKGWGGSEGVQAKREAYGQMILISVHCVTGPTNFDPSTGDVEFEPGSRSHALHLAYMELPSMERLAGDIAAYPLITAEGNRSFSRPGILNKWGSEGWTGEDATRPRLHQPWDTLKAAPALAA